MTFEPFDDDIDEITESDDDFESECLERCVKCGHLEPFIKPDGSHTFEYTEHGYRMMKLLELGQEYFGNDEETWEIFQDLVCNQYAENSSPYLEGTDSV